MNSDLNEIFNPKIKEDALRDPDVAIEYMKDCFKTRNKECIRQGIIRLAEAYGAYDTIYQRGADDFRHGNMRLQLGILLFCAFCLLVFYFMKM